MVRMESWLTTSCGYGTSEDASGGTNVRDADRKMNKHVMNDQLWRSNLIYNLMHLYLNLRVDTLLKKKKKQTLLLPKP